MAPSALVILAAGMGSRFGGLKQLAPVGPDGETFLDYAAAGGLAAGFDTAVVVVRREIRDEIEDHVRERWPASAPVRFVEQELPAGRSKPLGTAPAVLAAATGLEGPFAVANADDVYAGDAYRRLHHHLTSTGRHAVVGFRLAETLVTDKPLSRALCEAEAGRLRSIAEGTVTPAGDGSLEWAPMAGGAPRAMDGTELVSMNLFGFQPGFLAVLEPACARFEAGSPADGDELRLPDVVGAALDHEPVDVIAAEGRSFGVTHRDEVERVRAEVGRLVASGDLPERLWG
jgi:hypothetical protein